MNIEREARFGRLTVSWPETHHVVRINRPFHVGLNRIVREAGSRCRWTGIGSEHHDAELGPGQVCIGGGRVSVSPLEHPIHLQRRVCWHHRFPNR
jgi:hypothetical protein